MGCDCHNYFPSHTRAKDIDEFLGLLGYMKGRKYLRSGALRTPYYFFRDEDFKYTTGIYSELYEDKEEKCLVLWTRTTIWRSKYDSDFHNYTIKQLRTRFGGYFVSDYGKNRYFRYDGPVREKAEAGLYRAYGNFRTNMQRARLFISFSPLLDEQNYPIRGEPVNDPESPRVMAANVLIPFMISSIEEFFRSSYVALLRYSKNRERIIQNTRLEGPELVAIDQGQLAVTEAVAKRMSFQDLKKINLAFKDINPKFDIYGLLNRPDGRRRESFWDFLDRLIKQRHRLIHQAQLNQDYRPQHLKRDIDRMERAVWRIYDALINLHGWMPVEKWER